MDASTDPQNPFSMPTMNNPIRHGSSEQDARGEQGYGSYLNSMGSRTPSRPTTPRSPRARSPDDEDDRRDDRSERREDRRRRRPVSEAPIGMDFRMRACETSLRDHTNELTAQRLMLQQMTEAFHQYTKDKEDTGKKLDWVSNEFESKVTEQEAFRKELEERHKHMLSTINEMIQGISQQFETLRGEIKYDQLRNELTQQLEVMRADVAPVRHQLDPLRMDIVKLRTMCQQAAQPSEPTMPPPSWAQAPPGNSADPGANAHAQAPPNFGAAPTEPQSQHGFGGRAQQPNFTAGFPQPDFGEQARPGPSGPVPKSPPQPHASAKQPGLFNVGSPLNPGNAQFGDWAPGAGSQNRAFDPREWSVDGRKVTKELKAFDGQMIHFDNWRRRIRDHFISVNCNYAKVFELAESAKVPIKWELLPTTHIPDLPYVNWSWIATHIWTFTGAFLTDNQLLRRSTLTLGQEFNGLELWRALYMENCGGSAEMITTERAFFIDFPKCERATDLQIHLGTWVQLKQKYGIGLPADHLIHMFHKILPDEVREELKRQRDIRQDLQRQIDYVYAEIGTFIDSKLSNWNISKLQQQLKSKSTGLSAVGASNNEYAGHTSQSNDAKNMEVPPPPIPDLASLNANIERMVNAAVSRGRDFKKNLLLLPGVDQAIPRWETEGSRTLSLMGAGAADPKNTLARSAQSLRRSRRRMAVKSQRITRERMRSRSRVETLL